MKLSNYVIICLMCLGIFVTWFNDNTILSYQISLTLMSIYFIFLKYKEINEMDVIENAN